VLAGGGKAAGERPFSDPEPARHFPAAPSFQLAQHHRVSEVFGKGSDLLIDQPDDVRIGLIPDRLRPVRNRGDADLPAATTDGHGTGPLGGADGDAVKPPPHAFSRADIGSTVSENEEYSLEGILGQVTIVDEPSADTEDHRPESADQLGEGGFILGLDEAGD
jgi:hypothetical protein